MKDNELRRIQESIKSRFPEATKIYKIIQYKESDKGFYRIVYELANGFSEILAEFDPTDNTIKLESYHNFLQQTAETIIDISNDPFGP